MNKNKFPKEFPFWARLKISKNRATLIIDEEIVINKNQKKRKKVSFIEKLQAKNTVDMKRYSLILIVQRKKICI